MLFQRTNKKLLLYKTVIWQQALLIVGSFVLCSLVEDGVKRKESGCARMQILILLLEIERDILS